MMYKEDILVTILVITTCCVMAISMSFDNPTVIGVLTGGITMAAYYILKKRILT